MQLKATVHQAGAMCSSFWPVSSLWAAMAVLEDRQAVVAADPLALAEGTTVPAAGVALQAVAKGELPRRVVLGWEPADSPVEAELARGPAGQRRAVERAALRPAALAAWRGLAAWLALAA